MIAPSRIPPDYRQWNRRWRAPFGSRANALINYLPIGRTMLQRSPSALAFKLRGMFSIQPNNTTREYEYPWAFSACRLEPGMRVLEIGGGLSGFQFVMAKSGAAVVNVDPGEASHGRGWPVDGKTIAKLNRAFGTSVELCNTFLQQADLEGESFDRVVSISTIEHIPAEELPSMMNEVVRLLRPGGLFIATIDLFLNLCPFTSRESNEYGTNISVADLIEPHGLELVEGSREELFGYSEFDASRVQRHLEQYLLGSYPALIQMVVARKREPAAS